MIRLVNIKKTLGDARNSFALRIEDLRVETPGVYALIGANGSGKSTAAKIMAGILKPDSGRVETALDPKEITMVTQKPYIMDDSVFNNIAYPLRLRGLRGADDIDRPCDEWLEKIGLLSRKNQNARGLSGGEKQKLALARAMVFSPRLLILDEAMTDLDLDAVELFAQAMRDFQARAPAAWILISHHLAQVRRLCESFFFMSGGSLCAQGPIAELSRCEAPDLRRYLRSEAP
ncbi:MAG: ABC transporter ATP-binding protein [Treponema sp.]|nr:ABC transporter ATP-binding protein [Treponema sp.]